MVAAMTGIPLLSASLYSGTEPSNVPRPPYFTNSLTKSRQFHRRSSPAASVATAFMKPLNKTKKMPDSQLWCAHKHLPPVYNAHAISSHDRPCTVEIRRSASVGSIWLLREMFLSDFWRRVVSLELSGYRKSGVKGKS